MAEIVTKNEAFFTELLSPSAAKWSAGVAFDRSNGLPLDQWSVFQTEAKAIEYLSNAKAYPGQVIAYADAEGSMVACVLSQNAEGTALELKQIGVIPTGAGAVSVTADGEISVNVDGTTIKIVDGKLAATLRDADNKSIEIANNKISMHDFGKAYYEYVPEVKDEEGNVTKEASYNRVEVSDSKVWKAGLEPKVVTENGELVIGWFEPNPTTVEGINNQVAAVQGTVADLEVSVGAPSSEDSEATGLYKEVEDVQTEVEELVDVVGSSDDSLNEDVQTIWAHVNDHADRLESLEGIDHELYALAADLEAEAKRADEAEKANAAAIKAIADDYLKAEHIANMATDAEVEAAVKVEADRAKEAEQGLQNQINLIMNNPDTENVINSINEFTQYIEEHGDIAEGFRSAIAEIYTPAEGETAASGLLVDEIARAEAAEGALSGRIKALEDTNHDFTAADEALKSDLEGQIALKADKTALESAVETLEAADSALSERIAANESALAAEGSVAKAIEAAKQAAISAAATDAATKAGTAKTEAIADADAKLALKANAADVYAKTETYSQAEVDALLEGIQAGSSESAASVNTKLEALKKALNSEVYGNEEGTGDSRIDTAEAKLATIANGAQVNVLESVVVANAEGEATALLTAKFDADAKKVTLNDSGLQAAITAVETKANNAGAAASTAQSGVEANTLLIQANADKIEALLGVDEQYSKDIAALQAHDAEHKGQYEALVELVTEHGETLADWASSKATTENLNAAIERIAKNETDIAGLGNTKLDKSEFETYKTSVIGTPAADKTIVQMIADAQAAATYDDTQVKADIKKNADAIVDITKEGGAIATAVAAEAAIARAAEKKNADDIAAINAVLNTVDNEDTITSLKELAIWVEEHGQEASKMAEGISDNKEAIEAINNETTGILALAKSHSDANLATAKGYTDAEIAKIHSVDDDTIKLKDNKAYVAKVSTDVLVQGESELVFCAGNATGYIQ